MRNYWEKMGWELEDVHLSKIKSMPFIRNFPFIPTEKGLYIIRGPRQIGKSSWLKTVLSHYAKTEKCFYLSCENISDNRELAIILESIRGKAKIILLDEISFVQNWDRAVKHEVDLGKHHIMMITGSHSHDLKKGSDQMPGRFDNGGEFYLLPMLFEEFYQARLQAGWAATDRVKELELYFKIGGFPTAVAEAGKEGSFPKKAMQTYLKWLIGDVLKLGKNEQYLEEVLIQLAICQCTPVSLQTIAKKTSIGSHNTVSEYIAILQSCFALKTLYAIDLDNSTFRFKKDKKFYFTDPLIYWIAHHLSGKKIPDNYPDIMAELVAHEHLSRDFRRFGYFSNQNGEIDFIQPGNWAREVKWSNAATNLSKSFINLHLLDKKVWIKNNFLQ